MHKMPLNDQESKPDHTKVLGAFLCQTCMSAVNRQPWFPRVGHVEMASESEPRRHQIPHPIRNLKTQSDNQWIGHFKMASTVRLHISYRHTKAPPMNTAVRRGDPQQHAARKSTKNPTTMGTRNVDKYVNRWPPAL